VAVPLLDLLAQLPKERWPKEPSDSLKWEQTNAWYEANLIGRRVSFTGVRASELEFASEGGGKYRATRKGNSGIAVELYGMNIGMEFYTGRADGAGFGVFGLSERAAEALRAWPKDKPLEFTFTITKARRDGRDSVNLIFYVKDTAIKGIE
jgi:hypothetical protein